MRSALLALSIALTILAFVSAKVSLKPPMIVERACYSTILEGRSANQTPQEIEAFVREAVSQRFDSDSNVNGEFLGLEEMQYREKEQDELKKRDMKQRVLVNSVVKIGDLYSVSADRLISVGTIRSAFIFPITLTIESVQRTSGNPYGLILTRVQSATATDDAKSKGGTHDKK